MSFPETQPAATYSSYGRAATVISNKDIPVPKISAPDEILIKIAATCFNAGDYKLINGGLKNFMKIPFPAVPGMDFSGKVVAKGDGVEKFEVGNEVYGITKKFGNGACTRYIKVSAKTTIMYPKPPSLTHFQAAATGTAAQTASCVFGRFPDKSELKNKKILIVGASGGVGSWCVLGAKYFEANVTGVCSTKNKEYVLESLKADRVIEYNVAPLKDQLTAENEFDFIIDCVGGEDLWKLAQKILKPGCSYATIAGPVDQSAPINTSLILKILSTMLFRVPFNFLRSRKYVMIPIIPDSSFELVNEWATSGKVNVESVVTKVYGFNEIKDALTIMESCRAVGKLVVDVTK